MTIVCILIILIGICIGVYAEVWILCKLLDAFSYEEQGRDFPERELWGRDWFDDREDSVDGR